MQTNVLILQLCSMHCPCLHCLGLNSELHHWLNLMFLLLGSPVHLLISLHHSFSLLFPFSVFCLTRLAWCYHSLMSTLVGKKPLLQCCSKPVTDREMNGPVSVICLFGHQKPRFRFKRNKPQNPKSFHSSLLCLSFYSERMTSIICSITKWLSSLTFFS